MNICPDLKTMAESIPCDTKKGQILKSIILTADSVKEAAKQFPKTGKKRNIFIKTYNRRPQNKKKRTMVIINMALSSAFGAIQISHIVSQPIPKFKSGSA